MEDKLNSSIGTPEGDNELAPDQPLEPGSDVAVEDLETPRGSKPDEYRRDRS